ncbi:hypothetical protein [Deinococcus sp. NW-56]|uniref:hypothetical protein n=1 Tax=Deinococcus sp. NW-56 TaxID=2080419 RepID=UPI001319EEE9|nr:hypothetical protein [Deinococcus sp. NW-56]
MKAVAARPGTEHPDLWAVVSNAGKSVRPPVLEGAARDDLGRLLAVNFSGPAALLLALLPGLVRRGRGPDRRAARRARVRGLRPLAFTRLTELPRTPSGKVQRWHL